MEITSEAADMYVITLQHLTSSDLQIACDEAAKRCKFFPNPAEILESLRMYQDRQKSGYYVPLPDPHAGMTPEEIEAINKPLREELEEAFKKMGPSRPRLKAREKVSVPYPWNSGQNYIAMVGSQTLQQWALDQDLNDTLPRTPQEIELIKQVKNYGKPKKKRQRESN
jgi:hypothetical protein